MLEEYGISDVIPDWANMSWDKRLAANISASELLDKLVRCPLIADMFLFNTIKDGFLKVLGQYNDLQELMERDNFGDELYVMYKKALSADCLDYYYEVNNFLAINVVETLIEQPEVKEKL